MIGECRKPFTDREFVKNSLKELPKKSLLKTNLNLMKLAFPLELPKQEFLSWEMIFLQSNKTREFNKMLISVTGFYAWY